MNGASKLANLFRGSIGRKTFAAIVCLSIVINGTNNFFLSRSIPLLGLVLGLVTGLLLLAGVVRRLRDIPLSPWWSLVFLFFQVLLLFSSAGIMNTPTGAIPNSSDVIIATIAVVCVYIFIGFLLLKKGRYSKYLVTRLREKFYAFIERTKAIEERN